MVSSRHEAQNQWVVAQDDDGTGEQDDVFLEGLPVGEYEGVAKAAAVGDGIGYCQIECEGCHDEHETQCEACCHAAADAIEQVYAHQELGYGEGAGQGKWHSVGQERSHAEGGSVVFYLVLCATRVDEFHHSGKEERQA